MRPLFGPRTIVEMAFLVAVPIIALEIGLSWTAIIGAGAVAYLLVLAVEGAIWREGRKQAVPVVPAAEEPPSAGADHVRVIRAEPEPAPEPEPVPVPIVVAPPPVTPQPEPVAVQEPPRLAPVPPPPPAPAPVPEPELPPAAAAVVRIGGPRQWNVWDLERVAREHSGGDPIADEERTFLLLYLRDFAGPDGLLPADFDDLVRQSFGGLVAHL